MAWFAPASRFHEESKILFDPQAAVQRQPRKVEREAVMAKALIRRFCMMLALSTLFQFLGCLGSGVARDFLIDGVKHAGFEFLLDNNGFIDLFTDS